MPVRAYLRSPAAVAWTLSGGVAVGVIAAVGVYAATGLRARAVATDPLFLGGLGELLYLVALFVLLAVAAVVWVPFGAGVAYAVGRRTRDRPASLRGSVTAVLDGLPSLGRWLKTRTALPGVGDYVLGEDDVAPTEVVTGCEPFVVPALVLDAPTSLERAVDRANRVTPGAGRERLLAGCLAATVAAAAAGYLGGTVVAVGLAGPALSVGLLVVGLVVTAALDAAWRARTYAGQDLGEGFRRA